jgi:hypothetical protein
MPLRDHFHPPLSDRRSWDMLHGMWPATIVQHLFSLLPTGYFAGPGVYLTHPYEVDVAAFDEDESPDGGSNGASAGGVAVATRATQAPTLTVETEWPDQEEYEVRIHDERRAGRLVATVEIVSPANKDRPESRRAFAAKCGTLLQQDVCVSIVDVVTSKQFNLYAELFELIGVEDPALGAAPPAIYAVTLRGRKRQRKRPLLDAWFHPLAPGLPLPALPLWLAPDLAVTLDLEGSYEDACRVLRIG